MDPIPFVEQHGVVLEGGRGPRPNLAEAVVGEPVRGSWWDTKRGAQSSGQLAPYAIAMRFSFAVWWVERLPRSSPTLASNSSPGKFPGQEDSRCFTGGAYTVGGAQSAHDPVSMLGSA